MKNYKEAIMFLTELSDDEVYITPSVCYNALLGACICYCFDSLCVSFFDVISLEYMKSNYEFERIYDIHDNYHRFKLPDGSVLNISDHFSTAFMQIPIKNT